LSSRTETDRIVEAAGEVATAYSNQQLFHHTSSALTYDVKRRRATLQIRPRNLLGAMWTQLATSFAGDREYRQCEQCSSWFALSTEDYRSDALYCSDRCKQKAYRVRKQAKRLAASGKSARTIAKQLGNSPRMVQRWIASP
jgi:hypothetical protein